MLSLFGIFLHTVLTPCPWSHCPFLPRGIQVAICKRFSQVMKILDWSCAVSSELTSTTTSTSAGERSWWFGHLPKSGGNQRKRNPWGRACCRLVPGCPEHPLRQAGAQLGGRHRCSPAALAPLVSLPPPRAGKGTLLLCPEGWRAHLAAISCPYLGFQKDLLLQHEAKEFHIKSGKVWHVLQQLFLPGSDLCSCFITLF